MQTEHFMANMSPPDPPAEHYGTDGSGGDYWLQVWPDGLKVIRYRGPGANSWEPPVVLAVAS